MKLKLPGKRVETAAAVALLLLCLAGVAARFVNIDRKEFWHDECYTALVISGHTTRQLASAISSKVVPFSDLKEYRTVGGSSTIANILHSISEDEPGHAPIFYFKELVFCKIFGSTPFTMRLVSVLIGVATLPVVFWLALETYELPILALLTLAFACLSPSMIYYAQEARDYSLGIFFMFTTSACLLFALRKPSKYSWAAYCASVVLGLYSWLFMTIVVAAQLLYVVMCQKRTAKIWRPFTICLALAGLSFLPWLAMLSQSSENFSHAYDWIQSDITLLSLLTIWLAIPYKAFALFGFKTARFGLLLLIITILQFIALALSARHRSAKSLQLIIIAVWFAVFAGQDAIFGGARSAPFRYHSLVIGSVIILFAYLIQWLWQQRFAKVAKCLAVSIVLFIFSVEALSDIYMLHVRIWPDKAIAMRFTDLMATSLNREKDVVLVCEQQRINLPELLDLSIVINPETRLLFRDSKNPQPLPTTIKKLYLWNPSSDLETELSRCHYTVSNDVDDMPYLKLAVQKK